MERVPMMRILDLVHSHKLLEVWAARVTQVENDARADTLHFTGYSFVRIHEALRVSPAMQAGIGETLWSVADLARFVD
jgi:hypothetical protein